MRVGKLVGIVALLVASAPLCAKAFDVTYVDTAGVCQGFTPCYTTIQAGVNHVTETADMEAGTVLVFPGLYQESVNLSLMGSAVGGTPGDINILNADIFRIEISTLSSADTTGSVMPQLSAAIDRAAKGVVQLSNAIQKASQLLSSSGSGSTALVASGFTLVEVRPTTGPGFYNAVTPFPGEIELVGFDITSPDDDGIIFNATDEISIALSLSHDNGKTGATLTSGDQVSLEGFDADDNTGEGMVVNAKAEIMGFDPAADGNGGTGMDLTSTDDDINVLGGLLFLLVGGDNLSQFRTTTADHNDAMGIFADSDDDATVASIAAEFPVSLFGLTIGPVSASHNGSAGIALDSVSDSQVIGADVESNGGHGVVIDAAGIAEVIEVASAFNDLDGFNVTAAGSENDFIDNTGAFFLRVRSDSNKKNGITISTTTGIAVVTDSAIARNTNTGVALVTVPTGLTSLVEGNIICFNGVGLSLAVKATVNAEGNWWGSTSGPFHMVNNPSGTGNAVVDGTSGGGMGTVDFLPFIDTVTASAEGSFSVGAGTTIRFQFSGGNGSVFLGPLPQLNFPVFLLTNIIPGPFALATDNGVLLDPVSGGPAGSEIAEYINEPEGVVATRLIPNRVGPATVNEVTPCDLEDSITVNIGFTEAPAMSAVGLAALALALVAFGMAMMRRKRIS